MLAYTYPLKQKFRVREKAGENSISNLSSGEIFLLAMTLPDCKKSGAMAALQPVKYLQKYSREQTIESASDEMTYKLVKFHGTKEG